MVLYPKVFLSLGAVVVAGASSVGGYYIHQHFSKERPENSVQSRSTTPPSTSAASTGSGGQ